MIDSHCHLQTEQFDSDREAVIAAATEAGVEGFIVPAIDTVSFAPTISLAASQKNIWGALGIHPHSASEWGDNVKARIIESIETSPKIVAIGELGLDYYYDFSPRDVQVNAFTEQIELAQQLHKPIIIHTRDSIDETLDIVSRYYKNERGGYQFGQFHCFTGTPEQAERVVGLGFAVSFTGNITFKNSTLAPTVQATPLDAMLIETDSPYLAPAPFRGKRNSPAMLRRVAEKIAEITQHDVFEIMNKTTKNAKRVFGLSAVALILVLLGSFISNQAYAQPGSKPPDSVMTQQRREAEELVRRQREELAKEQEKRREDSIRVAYEQQQELIREANEQARKDSIKAVERMQEEERDRIHAATPIVWKAIGIGGGVGIGNISDISQSKRLVLSPTSVFASSLSIGTAITRGIDFKISYNSFTAGDDLGQDNLFRATESSPPDQINSQKPPPYPYFRLVHEDIANKYFSFDFHFMINPRSPVKFYLGLGYDLVKIENTQTYYQVLSASSNGPVLTDQKSFSRGGIKAIFGAQYDLEIGENFILTPFADISASFMLTGDPQAPEFDFRTSSDPITFTHLNVGAQLYFGWFSVKRY
ncbi:MAG TPA: TatD family hydrolase [Candidatus Kapabacteria bacterium]|nr:TatD family hydrolase [Candidatus Kapabacteria bacterium]